MLNSDRIGHCRYHVRLLNTPGERSFNTREKQEAQLSQRDRATLYVSKFMLFYEV